MIDTYSYESVSPSFKVFHFSVFYSILFCKMLANNRAKSIGTSTFPLHHTSARQLSVLALYGSEPGGDHILISTLLIFKCLLYRNKVTASRSSTHRLGCVVYNCKLACSLWKKRTLIKQHPWSNVKFFFCLVSILSRIERRIWQFVRKITWDFIPGVSWLSISH